MLHPYETSRGQGSLAFILIGLIGIVGGWLGLAAHDAMGTVLMAAGLVLVCVGVGMRVIGGQDSQDESMLGSR